MYLAPVTTRLLISSIYYMVQNSENPQTGNWADEPVNPSIQGIIQMLQEQINRTQAELMNYQTDTQSKLEQVLLAINRTH